MTAGSVVSLPGAAARLSVWCALILRGSGNSSSSLSASNRPILMNMSVYQGPDRRKYPRSVLAGTATVLLDHAKAGDYLMQNVSAGGVLLSGGPAITQRTPVVVLLRLSGLEELRLAGFVVRRDVQFDDAIAVKFRGVAPDVQDMLQGAVLMSLERKHDPSVLVVDGDIQSLSRMAHDLDALGYRAILACTPLDTIRWLTNFDVAISVVVVEYPFGHHDGVALLRVMADEFPFIRRVLMSSQLGAAQLGRWVEDPAVDAVLSKPWSRAQLAAAVGRPGSYALAARTDSSQRMVRSSSLMMSSLPPAY